MRIPHGWRTGKIADFGQVVTGSTPPTSDNTNFGGPIPFVTPGDLGGPGHVTCAERSLSSHGARRARVVPPMSTLVVCIGSTIGKVRLTGCEVATNQQINAIVPKDGNDPGFVFYETSRIAPSLRRLAGTQAVPILSKGEFEDYPVSIPPAYEQRKIAHVLGTWDDALEKLNALNAAKERRKKALMQQLLSGNRRLVGVKGKWIYRTMGDLLREERREVVWDDSHTFDLLSVRRRSCGVFRRGSLDGDEIKTKVMRVARAGDFLISKMQVVHGAWALVRPEFDGGHVSGSYICLVSSEPESFDIRFFDWLSRAPRLRHQVFLSCWGVVIEKMTFDLDDFLRRTILVPPTRAEQTAIADALDAAETEIRLLTKKRAALEAQKRGLMQQLLTGKVRVSP